MSELHCLTSAVDAATVSAETTAPGSCSPESKSTREPRTNALAVTQAIERAIRRGARLGVRELEVQVRADGVHLRGFCSTYYCKQLAQHAASTVVNGTRLHNEIEVW
jgi:osmotically-inducible protein OsmY